MSTMNLDDLPAPLADLITNLDPNEPLVITRDGRTDPTLTRSAQHTGSRQAGSGRTEEFWMADDFDAPLEEFRESME